MTGGLVEATNVLVEIVGVTVETLRLFLGSCYCVVYAVRLCRGHESVVEAKVSILPGLEVKGR
jgi:hypothetical protein